MPALFTIASTRPVLADRLVHERGHIGAVGHVDAADVQVLAFQCGQPVGAPGTADHQVSLCGQADRDGFPDSTRHARDQDDLVLTHASSLTAGYRGYQDAMFLGALHPPNGHVRRPHRA